MRSTSNLLDKATICAREIAIADALDEAAVGVAIWDRNRRLVYANRFFLASFHQVGSHSAARLAFRVFLRNVAASNEIVLSGTVADWVSDWLSTFGRERQSEQAMADGRTLEIVQRPLRQGGMTVTVHDVSTAKRMESALRQATKAAESSDEAKSRFLRAANHDLRQPLATLKILIFNCLTEPDEDHRRDLLHAMDLSAVVMEDLLGALLQVGQLDAGQIRARVTTFQVNQIFERLRIQFSHVAAEKGLKLRFVGAQKAVVSDKALLERILANLVSNAIRYTDVGGVLVGCRRHDDRVRVEVWDSGRGIVATALEKIFDEFYQVSDGRRATRVGLGLGLNIVKRLAGILDHPIAVRSVFGQGSVFSVDLTAGDVWNSELAEPEISETIGGEFAGVPILLIEDDDALRETTARLLERWGMDLIAVTSGEEALRRLSEGAPKPRLILADYSLRGHLGTDAVRSARARIGQEVPAVVLTADVSPSIVEQIRSEGFPLLIKPVSPPRLRVMMHNLLFEPSFLGDSAIDVAGRA